MLAQPWREIFAPSKLALRKSTDEGVIRYCVRDPSTAHLLWLRQRKHSAQDDRAATRHAFAFLCISTVLQVLSAAWQIFSSGAVDALGFAGDAELASVPDDLVGKENPFLARDDAHQVLLDLLRVIVRGEFETARDAVNMGVDDYAFGFLEPRAQHDVGGFAGDAGEGEQLFHVVRDLAAEVGDDFFRGADHGFRLVAEETGGADVGLELFRVSAAKASTVGYLRKSSGVTRLTLTSVDWAERIVATRSSHALVWVRAQVTSG